LVQRVGQFFFSSGAVVCLVALPVEPLCRDLSGATSDWKCKRLTLMAVAVCFSLRCQRFWGEVPECSPAFCMFLFTAWFVLRRRYSVLGDCTGIGIRCWFECNPLFFWISYTVVVGFVIHPSFGVVLPCGKIVETMCCWLKFSVVGQRLVSIHSFIFSLGGRLRVTAKLCKSCLSKKKPTLSSVAGLAVAVNICFGPVVGWSVLSC
jgi:hypothetical protein